jgi:antitoxin CptB
MTAPDRIRWQCRRGMRELDEMLMSFLRHGYDALDSKGNEAFVRLLSCPDPLLLEYLMGRTIPVDPDTAHVVKQIRQSAHH